jgi:2-oxoisovalerate dehydrogenase E1 component beta subunit
MTAITLVEAVNLALRSELKADPNVVILGQDVGLNGGVFRATDNLQKEFGEERVRDTPLAENLIAGLSVGMAAQGLRPVAEIQFMDFICAAIDQIFSHATRMRNRTRGRLSCPLVIRTPSGGGIRAPEHHSESLESIFAHMPGLRVVMPSSPARAYGLLLAAIRDPDPVLFLEPKRIYRLVKEEVLDNGEALPLDVCFTLREGSDLTLVSWGAMLHETLNVADKLAQSGISCEVIDVATIKPLDMDTIIKSVEKTGRCVIVQEANPTCSVSAEIAANVAEKALTSLLAPIVRVTGYDVPMPLYRMEKSFLPSEERIMQAAKKVMENT